MTVGLEKLVQDIKNETSIWPIEKSKNTPEEDAAWERVGARNKMSGNHVKSIFKVLSKKYETEKSKPNTNWKLFEYLKFLDVKIEPELEEEDDVPDDADLEDDGEFVELLEVNEYDESDDEDNESGASGSGQSSRNVSTEEGQQKQTTEANASLQKIQIHQAIANPPQHQQQQKLSPQQQIKQLKGIEVKKVINTQQQQQQQTKMLLRNSNEQQQNKKSISPNVQLSSVEMKLKQNYEAARKQTQYSNNKRGSGALSDSLKRKLPQSEQIKKTISSDNGHKENISMSPPPAKKTVKEFITTPQGLQVERIIGTGQRQQTELILTSGQITPQTYNRNIKSSTDKIEPKIENDKLLSQQQNGFINEKNMKQEPNEIIENVEQQQNSNSSNNENNIETILPSFFRDLYNSKKYDCFGMYVASAMNRLPSNLASKLETKILQAIIEVNSLVSDGGD